MTDLQKIGHVIRRPAGSAFMLEGEYGDFALLIRKGHVKVTAGQPPRIIAIRGPGDIVGELAVLRRQPRSASVFAFDDVEALHLPPPSGWVPLRSPPRHARAVGRDG